ncbi:MAG TPA: methyltransferase domain-containing protein [Solirubrobacteraceae bacterium]|nr:methyltransferase domain-containing protein [Solirubrobacteraceae bacterium]
MQSRHGCRICTGPLELVRRGGNPAPTPEQFAPAQHVRGAHGDLYRCRDCGTVQQPSLPASGDLHDLYRRMHDDLYLLEEHGRRAAARRLLDLVAAHVPSGGLLDVGCGYGLLLDEARARGYDVLGLELSAVGVHYARDVLGLRVLDRTLEEARLESGSFDAIVMTDVFEHLDDPLATLDLCTELLAPGGVLALTTPDPSSRVARLAGRRWWSYLLAHHCLVPRATMRELITARGLVTAGEHPYVRVFSLDYWLEGFAGRSGALGAAARRAAGRLSRDRLLALAMHDEWTYVARKVQVIAPPRPLAADRGHPLKVHAVIPAHNAERTIAHVAAALPTGAIDRALMVDDASTDGTVRAALAAGLEVLPHPVNMGYGANQKTCYVRAALDGADIVVMVHGDNQYDPALVAEMTKMIEAGAAEVVLGSRLLEDEAIASGMPHWKWVGNRALTMIENLAFRRNYSEYHTGYRAFSIDFLRSVPFLRNSDRFVFDQEIFAQIVGRDARVVELPIPTRYFLEASSVSFRDSVRYGLGTLSLLARFRLDARRRRWLLLRRPAVSLVPSPSEPEAAPPALVGPVGP